MTDYENRACCGGAASIDRTKDCEIADRCNSCGLVIRWEAAIDYVPKFAAACPRKHPTKVAESQESPL